MANTAAVSEDKSKAQSVAVKFGIYALILLVVFLLGFIPMWLSANNAKAEHEVTKKLLVKEEITNSLTTGIIDARRGEYESARQDASDFYSKLRMEIEKEKESAYTEEQIKNLKNIFDNRDAMITLLAQRDQASVERLTDVYLNYQQAVGEARPATENKDAANTEMPVNSQ